MFCHLFDHCIWNRCDISTCQRTICYVDRISYTCCDDLCIQTGNIEDLSNLADQIHTSCGNIIQSSQERRNVGCTGSCSQQCLVCSKDQCYVCFNAFCGQHFAGFQTFYCHRDLYNHVRMDRCDLSSFRDHAFCVYSSRFYFTADRSVYNRSDLFDDLFKVSSLFCDQGRVCGNATDHAHVICFFDVFYFRGVDEKSHCFVLLFFLKSARLFSVFCNCSVPSQLRCFFFSALSIADLFLWSTGLRIYK